MGLSKNWPQNHPQILLHFLIHTNGLMLCTKFELIPSSTFQVMDILKTSIRDKNGYKMQLLHTCTHKNAIVTCTYCECT